MPIVHVVDFLSLNEEINIPMNSTVGDLISHIKSKYGNNLSHFLIIHNGDELTPRTIITNEMLSRNNTIVLLDRDHFKEKSFPKVNGAINFSSTRFADMHIPSSDENEEQEETDDEQNDKTFEEETENSDNYQEEDNYYHEDANQYDNRYQEDYNNHNSYRDSPIPYINYNPNELNDVQNLVNLGVDRLTAIQIYEACNRNYDSARAIIS